MCVYLNVCLGGECVCVECECGRVCMYVRKSAHERKQMTKHVGQIFNNTRAWVKVIWVFCVLFLFLHL